MLFAVAVRESVVVLLVVGGCDPAAAALDDNEFMPAAAAARACLSEFRMTADASVSLDSATASSNENSGFLRCFTARIVIRCSCDGLLCKCGGSLLLPPLEASPTVLGNCADTGSDRRCSHRTLMRTMQSVMMGRDFGDSGSSTIEIEESCPSNPANRGRR